MEEGDIGIGLVDISSDIVKNGTKQPWSLKKKIIIFSSIIVLMLILIIITIIISIKSSKSQPNSDSNSDKDETSISKNRRN